MQTLTPSQRSGLLMSMQASDLRVASIAYRLASSGESICPRKAALVGITLHEAAQYDSALRDQARQVMKLLNRVGVLAVAAGSPAEKAGLEAGDGLVSIAGRPVVASPPVARGVYKGVATAYAQLAQAAAAGDFDLVVEREGRTLRVTVTPTTGCVSQVQLLPSPRIGARADGLHLSVTTSLVDYVANDDELALVIAHEMAHNALGHRAQFEAQGVRRGLFGSYGANAAKVLEAERAADRLAYFLMARAGFDPRVALAFWPRLYAGPAGGHETITTHPDQSMRINDAREAIAQITAARAAGLVPTP
ncbi:MAG TPA: M48 family metallopeptidase [Sphingomonadaceae bacterium]|nr:M48 family metallopeptidase [Sphingomonadaceae bacterium]